MSNTSKSIPKFVPTLKVKEAFQKWMLLFEGSKLPHYSIKYTYYSDY